jgi:hypothetical protein
VSTNTTHMRMPVAALADAQGRNRGESGHP